MVAALFDRVAREHGRLDVLVNNAIALPDGLTDDRPFWEKALDHHRMFDVGLVWMGILRTERTLAGLARDPERYGDLAARTESPELTGRVLAALLSHPDRMRWTGRTVVGAELARDLGVTDVDGAQPPSHRGALGAPTEFNPAVVR